MLKLHEYYNRPVKNGDIGIELEVEFKQGHVPLQLVPECWLVKHDESLKNGAEYVSRQPFKVGPTLLQKIKSLTDLLNHPDSKVDHHNPRASTHIHINVQNKTPVQIWNAILSYWLVENILIKYCMSHRIGNHFCMRLEDAPGILNMCYNSLEQSSTPFSTIHFDSCKYSSINLATISAYGSLEFRTLHSTCDPNVINRWASSLYHLVEQASRFSSPAEIMDKYAQTTKDEFLYAVLPYDFVVYLTELDKEYIFKGKKTKRILAPLAYYHDWSAWEKQFTLKAKMPQNSTGNIFINATIPVVSLSEFED